MFKIWILNGTKINLVKEFSRTSVSEINLRRYFHKFLDNPPLPKSLDKPKEIYLKVDAKYFGRWGCLLLYKAGKDLIYWNFVLRENFHNYVFDLIRIKELGYIALGVTSDWHGSLVSAVDFVFKGSIPHQRCLVHTQRLCETLLTKNPKTEAGINLLEIVRHLNQIGDHYGAKLWINRLKFWEGDYEHLTKERTYGFKEDGTKTWWYSHKKLRRAFRALRTTLGHLFQYLDYDGLEKDVNGLESEFSHLKQKINMHRGLKRERQIKAIYWFCHLVSLRRKKDQKTNTF